MQYYYYYLDPCIPTCVVRNCIYFQVIVGELQDKASKQDVIIQQLNRDLLNMKQEVEKLKNHRDTLRKERDEFQVRYNNYACKLI